VVGVIAGRDHDQLRIEGGQLIRNLRVRSLDEVGSDHAEQLAVLLTPPGGDHEHPAPELDQDVGDGEARDAETQDGDAESAPVGVPAGERGEPRFREVGHGERMTHSR